MALSMAQTPGSPYVTLTKTGTNGDFTVTRTVAGVQTPVRGTLTVAGGTGVLVDREAPQGVSVSYAAGADSTSGTTLSVGAWLIHPATSALDMAVTVSEYPAWTRGVRQESMTTLGGKTPVVVSGPRQAREAGGFTIAVTSGADATALAALLESTRVLLLSTTHYPAPYLWVAVGEEQWNPMSHGATDPVWLVTVPLTEVARPEALTSGAVTWLDVSLRYATFDDLAAEYGTFDAFWADAITWTS